MSRLPLSALMVVMLLPASVFADLQVVVLEGLGGEQKYTEQFATQVDAIERAANGVTSADRVTVFRSGEFSRESVIGFFGNLAGRLQPDDRLAVYLVGHGSFDDHEYKFNIAGPDLTDADLLDMLNGITARQLLVNSSSSSGAIADRLHGENRTLILATRSGAERHATRFGQYFALALSDATADLDKNGIISAQEAFDFADRQVTDFYARNGQLATEHARVEGEQAARFGLARLGPLSKPTLADAELRNLLSQRDELNAAIEDLRLRRDAMAADAYQSELLGNMLELARLEEQIERREAELADEN